MPGEGPVSFWQAVTALLPLVGGGGLSAIIVAFLGYRQSVQRGGKKELSPQATLAIGTLYADRDILERLAAGGDKLTEAIKSLGDKVENGIDEIRGLRRAVEDVEVKRSPRR